MLLKTELNKQIDSAQIRSVSDGVTKICDCATEHVALWNVVWSGPCRPGDLRANVGAKDVGSRDGCQMRIVDSDEGDCLFGYRIVNDLPVIFGRRDKAVIVGIER